MTGWALVRFLHVLAAALWVGGQLTVSLVALPLARRLLDADHRAELLNAIGRRFGVLTVAVILPVQIVTGVLIAWHKGVTLASLAYPGYGQTLAIKLLLVVVVMACAALHGWGSGRGYPRFARTMAVTSLVGSVAVILLAAALPVT